MRYIIVLHQWFISSHSSHVYNSEVKTFKEAEKEAKVMRSDCDNFEHSAYTVIEIANTERPSELSWIERLTGRLRDERNKH